MFFFRICIFIICNMSCKVEVVDFILNFNFYGCIVRIYFIEYFNSSNIYFLFGIVMSYVIFIFVVLVIVVFKVVVKVKWF